MTDLQRGSIISTSDEERKFVRLCWEAVGMIGDFDKALVSKSWIRFVVGGTNSSSDDELEFMSSSQELV